MKHGAKPSRWRPGAVGADGLLLQALLAVVIALPVAGAVRDVANMVITGGGPAIEPVGPVHDGMMLVRTLGYPLAVGVLATLLAWPAAWIIRSGGSRGVIVGSLTIVPVMLPSYLAFAGYRLACAPGSWLGDVLAEASPEVQVTVWRVLAVVGLSLWSMPIAALVLASGLSRVPAGAVESLRIDGTGRLSRGWQIARMALPAQLMAVAVVVLLTIGSAVPIHLAQIDTLAQRVWWRLQLSPSGQVWLSAWPAMVGAVAAGWALTRALVGPWPESDPARIQAGRGVFIGAAGVWALAVIAPIVMFALSLRSVSALGRFWTELGPAAGRSTLTGACVGAICAVLCGLVWMVASRDARGLTVRAALMASIALAVMPGVLVGQALVSVWSIPGLSEIGDWLDDFDGRVILAHTARFAVVPVLVGYWLARSEPADLRDTRRVDGATGAAGWWRASGRARSGAILGVGLACFALSLHEIESSVIVIPPGSQSLPQKLLELLHYNRDEQLAAAALTLVGLGLLVAVMAGRLLIKTRKS